jgi:hypothetical protein
MLANPCPRPRKHLTDVPVINLGERIGIARSQEFRVRRRSDVASHNLYFAAPQKVCQLDMAVAVCGTRDGLRMTAAPSQPRISRLRLNP